MSNDKVRRRVPVTVNAVTTPIDVDDLIARDSIDGQPIARSDDVFADDELLRHLRGFPSPQEKAAYLHGVAVGLQIQAHGSEAEASAGDVG